MPLNAVFIENHPYSGRRPSIVAVGGRRGTPAMPPPHPGSRRSARSVR